MTAKEKLAAIVKIFKGDAAAAPVVQPTPPPAGLTSCAYGVDGGSPVYVDISDDGLPDIDSNDKVFSDPAMTVPYPDGTYKVTGTAFGFTVAGGLVSAVDDTAGTGPGQPMTDPGAMAAPVTTPVPPAPTVEERLAAIEATLAKLNAPAAMSSEVTDKFTAQEKIITKHEETISGLFELIDLLVKEPTADPVTLTGNKKDRFDRMAKRDTKFEKMAEAMKKRKILS